MIIFSTCILWSWPKARKGITLLAEPGVDLPPTIFVEEKESPEHMCAEIIYNTRQKDMMLLTFIIYPYAIYLIYNFGTVLKRDNGLLISKRH